MSGPMCRLDWMYRNLKVLPWDIFQSIYGKNTYSYIGPDNTRYLACVYSIPKVKVYLRKRHERLSLPKRNDLIVVIFSDILRKGYVRYIRKEDDDIGVYFYDTQETETYSLSCVETYREGRVRWKIEG